MRKLYRKSTVHPTLTSSSISDHHHLASFLPAAILTLTAALTPEDKEVLAYLLSRSCSTSSNNKSCNCNYRREKQKDKGDDEHCAMFCCSCFQCYMSYWIRWDASPDRQLIHEIIDAFEESLVNKKSSSSKKNKRKKSGKSLCVSELTRTEFDSVKEVPTGVVVVVVADDDDKDGGGGGGFSDDDGLEEEFDDKGGSMRKFVSFIGDRIWGVFRGKQNDDAK